MTDPRDTPGWTQQREPPDDSECTLLRKMVDDGYHLTLAELDDTYARLGGAEHMEMIESLERREFCTMESTEDSVTYTLTEQGRKALGLA